MYTIILSLIIGGLIGAITSRDLGYGWGGVCFLGAALLTQLAVALILRSRVGKVQKNLEEIMRKGQEKANRLMMQFERRPPSSERAAREQLEAIQSETIRKTLSACENYRPFYRWNVMLPRQINAMKMQLHFQLREYGKVDELMKKAMLFDSRSLLIKLVRLYKKEDPQLDQFYQKKLARGKGEDGAFSACVYAWMKLRQSQPEKAVAALVAAKKSSDNPTLLENCDRLVNGKAKNFSNAGFGDLWYSLYLEEPKVKVQRQARGRMF